MHTSTMRAPTASAAGLKNQRCTSELYCAPTLGTGTRPRCTLLDYPAHDPYLIPYTYLTRLYAYCDLKTYFPYTNNSTRPRSPFHHPHTPEPAVFPIFQRLNIFHAVSFGQGKPPRCHRAAAALVRCQAGEQELASVDRRGVLTAAVALVASVSLQGRMPAFANNVLSNEWEKVCMCLFIHLPLLHYLSTRSLQALFRFLTAQQDLPGRPQSLRMLVSWRWAQDK